MLDSDLLAKLRRIKEELAKEGFIIDGVFGSFARGENSQKSDIDLLYHVETSFLDRYGSFKAFKKIEEIKNYIQSQLQLDVDLAPSDNLSKTAKKYIYKDLIRV